MLENQVSDTYESEPLTHTTMIKLDKHVLDEQPVRCDAKQSIFVQFLNVLLA